jgi:hypothetical protein
MQMFLMLRKEARQVLDDRRLDAFGRFVEQQHLRITRQRARNRQLLLLTAGEIAAAAAGELGQDGEQVEDLLRDLALASDHEPSFDILPDRHGAENLPALRHISKAVRNALVAR